MAWYIHDEDMADAAPGPNPCFSFYDFGQQFIGVKTALHEQLGFASAHELNRLLRGRMTMWRIDDFSVAEIEGEGPRDSLDLALGADQDGDD